MWNSGRLPSMMATVSPGPTPSLASPPATASTRSSSSAQVSETESSGVRTATISGLFAAVRRSASVRVGASTARPAAAVRVPLSILASMIVSSGRHERYRRATRGPLMHRETLAGQGRDVVVQPDQEEHEDEDEPDNPGALHDREGDPPATDLLGQCPEDVAAVERQERE